MTCLYIFLICKESESQELIFSVVLLKRQEKERRKALDDGVLFNTYDKIIGARGMCRSERRALACLDSVVP